MKQCPNCGSNTIEYNREYYHGEYITVAFCRSCGHTVQDDSCRERDLKKINKFKEQMSGVHNDYKISEISYKNTDDLWNIPAIIMIAAGITIITILSMWGLGLGFDAIKYYIVIPEVLIFMLIGIVLVLWGIIKNIRYKKTTSKILAENRVFNENLRKQKDEASNRIKIAYENSNKIIPFLYANPNTVNIIESYLLNKQCRDLYEAINKLEADFRYNQQRLIMERQTAAMFMQAQAMQQQAMAQQQTAQNISNINNKIHY